MADKTKKKTDTLVESDITTKRGVGRRAFLGIMAAGSAGAVLSPTQAAAADADGRPWQDAGGCPRGPIQQGATDNDLGTGSDPAGGGRHGSGLTDSDPSDWANNGRGAPYC
jgi:hypothetical protein